MKSLPWLFAFLCVIVPFLTTSASAEVILSVDFESMTVDQPAGEGGAAVGEPVNNYIGAMVRDAPFPSNCLEIVDDQDYIGDSVGFEFLDSVEVTEGMVEITVQLWFAELNRYTVSVREQGTASHSFNSLSFGITGDVQARDAAGVMPVFGQYEAGRAIELRIVHNLDTGLYDIWWDGAPVIVDRAHGIVDRGVGGLYFGFGHDSDLDGIMYMDDLLVEAGPATADEDHTWSRVKAIWR